MKRRLDLNPHSGPVMRGIGLFLVLIPLLLSVCALALERLQLPLPALYIGARASFALGLLLFVLFVGVIIAEQVQDFVYDRRYQRNRHHKLKLADGSYECQYCGCQRLREADRACPVCGKRMD